MVQFNKRVYEVFSKEENVLGFLLICEKESTATHLTTAIPKTLLNNLKKRNNGIFHHFNSRPRIAEILTALSTACVVEKTKQGRDVIYSASDFWSWTKEEFGGVILAGGDEELEADEGDLLLAGGLVQLLNQHRKPYHVLTHFRHFDFETVLIYHTHLMRCIYTLIRLHLGIEKAKEHLRSAKKADKNTVQEEIDRAVAHENYIKKSFGILDVGGFHEKARQEFSYLYSFKYFESDKYALKKFKRAIDRQLVVFMEGRRVEFPLIH